MTKKKALINLPQTVALLLGVFIVAFVGSVSGWRVANSPKPNSANTVFIDGSSGSIADVVENISPSVVSIDVGSVETVNNFFFGNQRFEVFGSGSGFIVSSDGIVVTNKHVVDENTTSITLIANDGTEYTDVELIATDPFNDVAFLKIKGSRDLSTVKLGDSSKMRVGDEVIAIGNALGIYDNTVTRGIISGVSRPVTDISLSGNDALFNLFQTDASINQGNSGGPLINSAGEVIGINTAVAGQAENIGFAIPINDIKVSLQSIIETGKLQRPYIGIRYISINKAVAIALDLPVNYGVLLDSDPGQRVILKDSPAEKAGLRQGDIITEVNGQRIDEKNPLVSILNTFTVGESANLTVLRGRDKVMINVTFEPAPENLNS